MSVSYKRGFTLIELLVVIAIIGLLASVILASLNSARQKGRNSRRVADVKQIQLAQELYYDSNSQYSTTTANLVPTYISTVPKDPSQTANGGNYYYAALQSTISTCQSFHLGAIMEGTAGAGVLGNDADTTGGSVCTGGGTQFNGNTTDCAATTGSDLCYDVNP